MTLTEKLVLFIISSFSQPYMAKKLDYEYCKAAPMLEWLGNKWALVVLMKISENEPVRFNELYRNIPSVSEKVLSQVLRQLTETVPRHTATYRILGNRLRKDSVTSCHIPRKLGARTLRYNNLKSTKTKIDKNAQLYHSYLISLKNEGPPLIQWKLEAITVHNLRIPLYKRQRLHLSEVKPLLFNKLIY